ncbi:hypothetical protein BaRGS_00034559, partial [Batillaria attramentaria]
QCSKLTVEDEICLELQTVSREGFRICEACNVTCKKINVRAVLQAQLTQEPPGTTGTITILGTEDADMRREETEILDKADVPRYPVFVLANHLFARAGCTCGSPVLKGGVGVDNIPSEIMPINFGCGGWKGEGRQALPQGNLQIAEG